MSCVSAHPRDSTCSHSAERWGNLICASALHRSIASLRSIPPGWTGTSPPIHGAHSTGFPQRGHTRSPDIALQQMRETIAAKRNEGRCRDSGSPTARKGGARLKRLVRRWGWVPNRSRPQGCPGKGVLNRGKVPRLAARAVNVGGCISETLRGRRLSYDALLQPNRGQAKLLLAVRCGAAPFHVDNGSRDVASRP